MSFSLGVGVWSRFEVWFEYDIDRCAIVVVAYIVKTNPTNQLRVSMIGELAAEELPSNHLGVSTEGLEVGPCGRALYHPVGRGSGGWVKHVAQAEWAVSSDCLGS